MYKGNRYKYNAVIVVFLLAAINSYGQLPTFKMTDTTVTACKGILTDSEKGSGGSGTYGNNEDFTFVINTGGPITLSFDPYFCVEKDVDFIRFYDGPSTASPAIGAPYSGTVAPPVISSTSGYLTIHFTSDANVTYCGWKARWSTKVPPPVPPKISINNPPACGSTTILVDLEKPVHCDSIYAKAFTVTGLINPIVISATALNCSGGTSKQASLQIDKPININCNYAVDYRLSLPDRCDSIYHFTVSANFMINTCPLNVTITPENDKLCAGSCTDIKARVDGCLGYTYSWSHGLPGDEGPHTVCPTVTTTYTLNVSDGKGANASNTVTITIRDPEITSPKPKICQSDSAFNFIGNPGGGTWSGNGIINNKTGLFVPDSAGPGKHTIYYELGSACSDTLVITVDSMDAGYDEAACIGSLPFFVSGFSPQGGTWTGSNIQPNGLFDPSAKGVYTITYTHPNGCMESKKVHVDDLLGPGTMDTICQSVPPFKIPVTPFGGRWSGKGIDSIYGIFDPDIAEGGLHMLTYTLHGCSLIVKIFVKPIDAGKSITACPSQGAFILNPAATPPGGVWSGKGISDPVTGTYDPWKASGGKKVDDVLVYSHPNGCTDTITISVQYTTLSKDTIYFCSTGSSMMLNNSNTGRVPGGGVWTGSGISLIKNDYYFNPVKAGVGVHHVIYSKNNCLDSVKMVVFPSKLSKSAVTVCSKEKPFIIELVPPGGKWKGNGIVNSKTGLFDPALAGPGIHKLVFTTPTRCKDTVTVTVNPFIPAKISGLSSKEYCYKDTSIKISFSPPGGTVKGPIINGIFNPSIPGPGKYQFIYSAGTNECFTADTIDIIIYPKLTTAVNVSKDTICGDEGSVITVNANGGNISNNYHYQWSHGLFPVQSHTVSPTTTTTYIVKTSDACSLPVVDSVTIHVYPKLKPHFTTSTTLCYGEKGFIKVNVVPSSTYQYKWGTIPVQQGDSIAAPAGGIYTLKITDLHSGCKFDTLVKVPSYKVVTALFSPNPSLACIPFSQKEITFIDISKNAVSGTWDFGKGEIIPYVLGQNPVKEFPNAGIYPVKLTVFNEGGCTAEYTENICILEPTPLFIPDVFSPNGDGINDILYVRAKGVEKMLFMVYDRWGEKVFETSSPDIGWDGTFHGKPMNTGVFVYYLEVLFHTKEKVEQKGDISLVR